MISGRGMKAFFRTISNFLIFFLLVAFVITCCLTLFISTLQTTLGVAFTQEEISAAAKATMANVIVISLIFAAIDYASDLPVIGYVPSGDICCSNMRAYRDARRATVSYISKISLSSFEKTRQISTSIGTITKLL